MGLEGREVGERGREMGGKEEGSGDGYPLSTPSLNTYMTI